MVAGARTGRGPEEGGIRTGICGLHSPNTHRCGRGRRTTRDRGVCVWVRVVKEVLGLFWFGGIGLDR